MGENIVRVLLTVLFVITLLPARIVTAAEEQRSVTAETNEGGAVEIAAPYGLLMEASTGKVIFEKDAHTAVAPASVTKVMTMLLIFEALEEGKIKPEDMVTVSEKAASMGGSQVFLEPNEKQTVDTMLKCIAVASANDACVAMAEQIAGSEEAFVERMNKRARELGMKNTNFVNCNGLDAEGHVISAYDVALMSRELLVNHPKIHDYCTIWMENITHTTAKGSSEFGLTNTNKLVRQYEYCTGLKTGSTGEAGFCVSATAEKDGMELIAVIMKGETSKSRFADAVTLLNHGFANYRIYRDADKAREPLSPLKVTAGVKNQVTPVYEKDFEHLLTNGEHAGAIEKRLELPKEVAAPVKEGELLGTLGYYYENEKLGEVKILAKEAVEAASYPDYVKRVWLAWMM